jgi:hypothetical protein
VRGYPRTRWGVGVDGLARPMNEGGDMPDKKHTFRTAEDYRDHLPCEACEPSKTPNALIEEARRELHHRAHVYVNTKNPLSKQQASDQLDTAAIAFTIAAAVHGAKEKT